MFAVLANRVYRRLFAAQVGTGLATVALGLLAWDLAGGDAGQVLGTALAIKMVAYVTLAPVAAALNERVPRRALLVALDLVRAGGALALLFVSEVWQVHVLILLLQAASAGFTPTFQATIPDVLPDEAKYTRALSRLAYDLESLLSPHAGGSTVDGGGLPGAVRGNRCGLFDLGSSGGQCHPAPTGATFGIPPSMGQGVPGHATAAGAVGIERGRRGCRCHGDCQHGGSGEGTIWPGGI